jgi:hypothetical protein
VPHARPLPTWIHSERFLARNLGRPILRFLHIEAAGGLVLLVGTAVALVWANSPWSASYEAVWSTEVAVRIGGHVWSEDLHHWVNDALMAVFFFVVGLEIKQELTTGHLARAGDALLPAVAALGGMAVPALVFVAVNGGGDGGRGWGIPMATDIAFALGALALFSDRVPAPLKVLLLAHPGRLRLRRSTGKRHSAHRSLATRRGMSPHELRGRAWQKAAPGTCRHMAARARPAAAASEPARRDPPTLRRASATAPSSRRRAVSKVKVEKVV